MPSVFRAGCLHTYEAADECEIYSQRQRTLQSYFANISRVYFTYATAKVLLFFELCKKIAK